MDRREFIKLSSCAAFMGFPLEGPKGFDGYLAKPEPLYKWEKTAKKDLPSGTVYDISLVSQTWQDIIWDHRMQIFYPEKITRPGFCTLYNTGGNGKPAEELMGLALANMIGGPVAFLYGIPKQPLYGGKVEDALVVHTWMKFLETGDETWPLHFPMAKAVIKAMDTVQAFATAEKLAAVDRFLVLGASKRGWTTWLVGASQDKRLAGIAPMVIDILNLRAQIPHQLKAFGKPSEQVEDYTAVDMNSILLSKKGERLIQLEDPYSYRDRLTLPKLLINGTNDRYWSQDALNLYWDGLKGPKWVLYVPNSGHGLEDRERFAATLTAFARNLADKKPLPKMKWGYKEANGTVSIKLESDTPLKTVRQWRVNAPTQDFRDSKWTDTAMENQVRSCQYNCATPESGYAATFAEAEYETENNKTYTLSTQICILKAPGAA